MDSTEQASSDTTRVSPAVWSLTVVHHPDASCIGRRVIVDREVTLGRELATLGAAGDRKLSRTHARVVVSDEPGEPPRIEDLGSRNGTFVDEARVERAPLAEGAIIGVGSLLLLAHRTPAVFVPPRSARVAGVGHALAAILAEIATVARRDDPVLFFGETGTGKGLLAEELHLASGRSAFVTVRCGSIVETAAHAQLLGEGDRAGLIESADNGTLFLDRLDDAPPSLQSAIVSYLAGSEVRRVGSSTSRRVNARVVASTSREPRALVTAGVLRDDLAARLSWAIEVPPLRRRREDIIPIALALLGDSEPSPVIHPDLALALVRNDWSGNVHALEAVVSRALLDATDGELRLGARIAASLADSEAGTTDPAVTHATTIARSGRFFSVDGGERVSLESRRTLAAILSALAREHEGEAHATLSVNDLLAIAWPGERVLPRAGASRVYVAITSLRRMGLREVIERDAQGYRIHPRARVRIVDG